MSDADVPPELAAAIYRPWEAVVETWEQFQGVLFDPTGRHPGRDMVWRGVKQADWGVMSSLYRALLKLNERPPTEHEMNVAEQRTLDLARKDWRFDDKPALELLAHLQHYGAPTRLLDVSLNPLIALWFAVEHREKAPDTDARLFAFVTGSKFVSLNPRWGGRYLRWHQPEYRGDRGRLANDWGTGRKRRVWRPPAYNARIAAQNGAFIIDGVPLEDPARRETDSRSYVPVAQLQQVSSINLRFSRLERDNLRPESAPVFTIRIKAAAKQQIREQLERRFGYSASSIYSDMSGLAEHLSRNPQLLRPEK
ncbi:FRG domain-containing protein [Amnibacterium soli]|uniref:FRG domain-containing protein n=1 Tax=Amnibacterium soli TaxID=1282736 RepID=A0ABP8YZP1_9MICO